MRYEVFGRNWWKPDGVTPESNARKKFIAEVNSEEEARSWCKQLNSTTRWTDEQKRLGFKYEFRSVK